MGWSIFPRKTHRRVKEMFLFLSLFALAQSLVVIFEPVFFYTEGIPIWRIALYYALHYSLYVVLLPVGGKVVARVGLESSLAISTPLFVIYFLCLSVMPFAPGLFWVALVLLTVHKIFYWPAFHVTFSRFTAGGERGRAVSWVYLISYGVGIVGPFVGGLVAMWFGFSTLFVLAAAVALLSSLALLRTKERYRVARFDYNKPWRVIFDSHYRRTMRAMLGSGSNLIHMFFWPIYVFAMLGSAAVLGAIVAIGTLVATLTGLVIGRAADRLGQRAVLRLILPFASLSFVLRPMAVTLPLVGLTDIYARMSDVGILIPLYSRIYTRARVQQPLSFVIAAEIVLSIAKAATAWILVGLFFVFLPYPAFFLAFLLAAALVFLHWFL